MSHAGTFITYTCSRALNLMFKLYTILYHTRGLYERPLDGRCRESNVGSTDNKADQWLISRVFFLSLLSKIEHNEPTT